MDTETVLVQTMHGQHKQNGPSPPLMDTEWGLLIRGQLVMQMHSLNPAVMGKQAEQILSSL